jgi:4-hydroxy-tetrahydrodipicolinate synthase
MSPRFHGVVTATATPFDARYAVDHGALTALLDWYIDCGVHGVSICGSQGEFFALDYDEHVKVIETAVKAVNGRVPVYAGTGAVTTRGAIALTQAAESIGADLAMVITPSFITPSPDELVAHYGAVAAATKLPVMLYNNPPRTQVNVNPATFLRCITPDNVIGIKDSSGDVTQTIEYVRLTQGKKRVFAGRDTIFLSILLHGAHGTISPAANVFPRLVVRLYDAFRAGEYEQARNVADLLAPLRLAWDLGSFPVVIKEAMALVGRSAGPTRPPILGLSDENRGKLARVVDVLRAADEKLARRVAVT